MTIELFSIFINAVVKSMETAEEVQQVFAVVLIGLALGVGVCWALSVISTGLAKAFFSNLI